MAVAGWVDSVDTHLSHGGQVLGTGIVPGCHHARKWYTANVGTHGTPIDGEARMVLGPPTLPLTLVSAAGSITDSLGDGTDPARTAGSCLWTNFGRQC